MFFNINTLAMIGTYEDRLVKNTKINGFEIDTVKVLDRSWIYETAVCHKKYRNGNWIIVDSANTKDEAIRVHELWCEKLSKENIGKLYDIFEGIYFETEKE